MQKLTQRLVCGVVCAFGFVMTAPVTAGDASEKPDEYYELMKVFVDTFDQIDRNYVKDVDRRKLVEAAVKGMLKELDQYSSYIGREEMNQFRQMVDQEFGGIGIQVHLHPKTERLTVITPLPGTPAYREGVLAGDVIMEIEGKSTEGFAISDAVRLLKGKPGTEVTIGVKHLGSEEIDQITIERAVIQVSTVLGDHYVGDQWDYFADKKNKIGYVRLTHFSRRSADELRAALDELKQKGMKALILDLRMNPGGLLSQATKISDLFIESGKIVSTKGRNVPERSWEATKEATYSGFPMVVLVNRYSASASEIVSACLQDHGRAVIVGERTWGKGSVQNVIDLEDGASALKLTTASYHRPSGKNIHRFPTSEETDEWGVSPNEGFEVKFTTKELAEFMKDRRNRDVITGGAPKKRNFEDRQLARAVGHLLDKLEVPVPAEPAPADAGTEKKAAARPAKPETSGGRDKAAFRPSLPGRLAA